MDDPQEAKQIEAHRRRYELKAAEREDNRARSDGFIRCPACQIWCDPQEPTGFKCGARIV